MTYGNLSLVLTAARSEKDQRGQAPFQLHVFQLTASNPDMTMDSSILRISDEVQSALAANQPVVALESTVIAHGLPRPQNLQTALRLEQIVRDSGAIPATVAILGGNLCAGLNHEQLRQIAESDDIRKVSTRDL